MDTLLRLDRRRGLQHPFLSFGFVAARESVVRCGLLDGWSVRVENTDFTFDYQIERVDSIRPFVESLARLDALYLKALDEVQLVLCREVGQLLIKLALLHAALYQLRVLARIYLS